MPIAQARRTPARTQTQISVVEMLRMLNAIHEEARTDAAMRGFAHAVGSAIMTLVALRKAAEAVLIEAERRG